MSVLLYCTAAKKRREPVHMITRNS